MPKAVVRLQAVRVGFGVAAAVLLIRAVQVQLVEGAAYLDTAQAQRTERVELPATRGGIFDQNGVPLALTQEMFRVGVAPGELRDTSAAIEAIAQHLGLSSRFVRQQLRLPYAYFHGPFSSSQIAPLREIRGVHLESELTRFYPNPDFARSVLGRPEAPGRPASGIERVLDTLLVGRPGSAVVLRDQFGRRYQSPSRLDAFPVPGHDLFLTIDAELQDIVERSLAEAIDRLEATAGEVVIMDPQTGELLAVASRRADGAEPPSVFTSVFEPGSTAKLFAAAALLEHELVGPDDTVWGEQGEYRLGGRVIEDETPEGWMTLGDVIRRSSNIGIVKFASRLTPEQHFMALRDFGLGTPAGIELPGESSGILAKPAQWTRWSGASLSYGYELAVTMLQLACAYSAIANDGILMQPALVRSVQAPDGSEVYRHRPAPVRRVMSAAVAAELRLMLRGVVDVDGTGSTAALVNYEVAGKTGSARRAGPGGYIPGSTTASFASMFPADEPQLVMVVKLDDPEGGFARTSAAPLTRTVLEQVLAAHTSALDPGRMEGVAASARPRPALEDGVVPYVVTWPIEARPDVQVDRRVPDVVGLSIRQAARRLHQLGLRARVEGRGRIASVVPAPGTPVAEGDLITIVGGDGDTRR
jgi:cell division protein FtsI (penicillin-binding protein 3)